MCAVWLHHPVLPRESTLFFRCLVASCFRCLKFHSLNFKTLHWLTFKFNFWNFWIVLIFKFHILIFEISFLWISFLDFWNFFLKFEVSFFEFQMLRSSMYSPRVASPGRTRGEHFFICCWNLLLGTVPLFRKFPDVTSDLENSHDVTSRKSLWRHFPHGIPWKIPMTSLPRRNSLENPYDVTSAIKGDNNPWGVRSGEWVVSLDSWIPHSPILTPQGLLWPWYTTHVRFQFDQT